MNFHEKSVENNLRQIAMFVLILLFTLTISRFFLRPKKVHFHKLILQDQSQSAPMDMDPHGPNMPFARVDFINIGSPAQDAGLQRGDLIVEFGTQNNSNFKNLMDIGNMVINSENRPIRIKLMRNGTPMTINLVPKKWSGKGLLGCKMIPLYKEC